MDKQEIQLVIEGCEMSSDNHELTAFLEELQEGDQLYVTPSLSPDIKPEDQECKYVLSGECGMSPELRLQKLEKVAESLGIVFCSGVLDYKVKRSVRMIDFDWSQKDLRGNIHYED